MSHSPATISHQLSYKLFFLTLLLLVMAYPAQAYYLTQSPEPFTMPGERENAPPSDKKGVFTVQDNFNFFTRNDGSSPILLPHSDYFIAADTIDINIPIFGMFSHPGQTTKDPLANMLYANLQVKKLLEEYAAIQERAEELLGEYQPTMPTGKIATTDSSKKSARISLKNEQDEQLTIRQELDKIQTRLASSSTIKTGPANPISTSNRQQLASRQLTLTFHELHNQIAQQPSNFSKKNQTPHSAATGKISTHTKLNKNLYEPNAPEFSRASPQRRSSYSDTGEISLPWIVELPFKIFNYILAHKITALSVLLILLLLFNFIFGARS